MADIDRYKDKNKREEYLRQWRNGHKDTIHFRCKRWYIKKKRQALLMVGRNKLECARCGCSDYDILEINHINGGGHEERKLTGGSGLMCLIVSGKRKIDDLNILCRPCNLVSAAERISGKKYIVKD